MSEIIQSIKNAAAEARKLLAVLIDPEKFSPEYYDRFFHCLPEMVTHIFVGGSTATFLQTNTCVAFIKSRTQLPVILFPGDAEQITSGADGILLLSLLSGRNPEYLVEQHVRAVPQLLSAGLEIIPTGYVLIDGGNQSAVARVSQTTPLKLTDVALIKNTAMAGEMMGKQLIYLEAGSGAKYPISEKIISSVKEFLNIPLIVGGGISNKDQLQKAYQAGADLVVIGTAFEKGAFVNG